MMPDKVPVSEYPPRPVSWLKRDALLFANTIGCTADNELHFLYELHPEFQVFPTYPIVLTFKYDHVETVDFLAENAATKLHSGYPSLDWSQAVDGRRRIAVYRSPSSSAGGKWEIRSKVLSVYDKGPGKGSVLEKEHTLVDGETGEVYTRAWETAFFVGTGGWGGERGVSAKRIPPPNRQEDSHDVFQTTPETAHLYRLNGDYNPLHASQEAGRSLGYGGIILHGLFSWNVAARCVLSQYGGNHGANLHDFEARFAAPVRPGDKLDIHMWDMGIVRLEGPEYGGEKRQEVRFAVKVGEQMVLTDGRALLGTKKQTDSKL